jgi:hypothetical protein
MSPATSNCTSAHQNVLNESSMMNRKKEKMKGRKKERKTNALRNIHSGVNPGRGHMERD